VKQVSTQLHPTPTAVVFAYHNVGVRCIKTLLARGVSIALVVTHTDSANEPIWFDSVAQLCKEHGITCITPESPEDADCVARIKAIAPDFIFSFYYRNMISAQVLELASGGAYNLHGSLLPKYRGRVPVNWAVLHGETETGVTLHRMEKNRMLVKLLLKAWFLSCLMIRRMKYLANSRSRPNRCYGRFYPLCVKERYNLCPMT